jgi:iron(III) transport system permease protein
VGEKRVVLEDHADPPPLRRFDLAGLAGSVGDGAASDADRAGIRFLPEAVGANRLSLLQVSPRMEEAARGLGETAAGAARRVLMPLAGPGMLAGAALVLLTTMKELPVTLLLAPTGYDTLAIEIWTAANDAAYGRAAAPALLLILLSAIPTLLLAARDREQVAR